MTAEQLAKMYTGYLTPLMQLYKQKSVLGISCNRKSLCEVEVRPQGKSVSSASYSLCRADKLEVVVARGKSPFLRTFLPPGCPGVVRHKSAVFGRCPAQKQRVFSCCYESHRRSASGMANNGSVCLTAGAALATERGKSISPAILDYAELVRHY